MPFSSPIFNPTEENSKSENIFNFISALDISDIFHNLSLTDNSISNKMAQTPNFDS